MTSIIPPARILTEGSARKGKNRGIKWGLLNLHPKSTIELLSCSKLDETGSKESVETIPPNCKGNEARIFPDLTTTKPPWFLIKWFDAIPLHTHLAPFFRQKSIC